MLDPITFQEMPIPEKCKVILWFTSVKIYNKKIDEEKQNISGGLKEQCHEDFAVLGQFCAKIITLSLYT